VNHPAADNAIGFLNTLLGNGPAAVPCEGEFAQTPRGLRPATPVERSRPLPPGRFIGHWPPRHRPPAIRAGF